MTETTPIFVNFLPGAGGNLLIRLMINLINPETFYFISSHGGCHAAGQDDPSIQGHVFTPPDGHRAEKFIDLLWEKRDVVFNKRGSSRFRIIPIHCRNTEYVSKVFPNAKQVYIYLEDRNDYEAVDIRHVYKNHMETHYWKNFHNAPQNFRNELLQINSSKIPVDTSIWDLTKEQFELYLSWRAEHFYSADSMYKKLDAPVNTLQIAFSRIDNDSTIVNDLASFLGIETNQVAFDLLSRYKHAQISKTAFLNLLKD